MRSVIDDPVAVIVALAWVGFLLHWGVSAIRTRSTTANRNVAASVLMTFALVALLLLLRYVVTTADFNLELWHRTL